jgi:hypothetical protein
MFLAACSATPSHSSKSMTELTSKIEQLEVALKILKSQFEGKSLAWEVFLMGAWGPSHISDPYICNSNGVKIRIFNPITE